MTVSCLEQWKHNQWQYENNFGIPWGKWQKISERCFCEPSVRYMYISPEMVKSAGGLYRWFMFFSNLIKNCSNSSKCILYMITTRIKIRVPRDMPLYHWASSSRRFVATSYLHCKGSSTRFSTFWKNAAPSMHLTAFT